MRKKFGLMIIFAVALMLLYVPGVFAGSLFYADNPSELASAGGLTSGSSNAQLVTGQCNVQSITVSGIATTADDYVLIYDGTDATGDVKVEVTIPTASETVSIPFSEAVFGTGVYAVANNHLLFVTVGYTQD